MGTNQPVEEDRRRTYLITARRPGWKSEESLERTSDLETGACQSLIGKEEFVRVNEPNRS